MSIDHRGGNSRYRVEEENTIFGRRNTMTYNDQVLLYEHLMIGLTEKFVKTFKGWSDVYPLYYLC